jgi:two-component system sensor histidine kinase PilS (NtrC family)
LRRLENEKPVRWLMVTRVAVTATLLVAAYAIEVLLAPAASLLPLYVLCAGSFLLVIAYAVAYRLGPRSQALVVMQITGDLLVVTGFVWATGGIASPMSFLYLVPIVTASLLLLRRGALATAAGASILYAGLALATDLGVIPAYPRFVELGVDLDSRHMLYSLLSHFFGFFLTALFASYLSEKLRRTDLELAEKQSDLDELKVLNENIVESINSGLVTTDRDGRVTFVNPGACDITRCRRHDLVGRMVTELFNLDRSFLEKIRGVLETERRFRLERPFRTPDGLERFLGIAVSILRDREQRPLGFIFIFQDLTEISALERQVRLRERMAALGEMAAGMAHELRNPLASISGSVQVLRSELTLQGEQLELMEIILRESQRLDQTIRDFLVFAKPARFTPERADVVALVTQSAKLLRNSREFHATHEIEIRSSRPEILCEIDVNRMKQVFWNLATNALKAMPRGGALGIGITEKAGCVEIVFGDQGIGMSEEEIERYFQPFQGGFTEGTGLGAAIVYRIVEEHGGTARLRSRPGSGTEVLITLPARPPSVAGGRAAVDSVAGVAGHGE